MQIYFISIGAVFRQLLSKGRKLWSRSQCHTWTRTEGFPIYVCSSLLGLCHFLHILRLYDYHYYCPHVNSTHSLRTISFRASFTPYRGTFSPVTQTHIKKDFCSSQSCYCPIYTKYNSSSARSPWEVLPLWPWRKTPQRYLDFPKLVIEKKIYHKLKESWL